MEGLVVVGIGETRWKVSGDDDDVVNNNDNNETRNNIGDEILDVENCSLSYQTQTASRGTVT